MLGLGRFGFAVAKSLVRLGHEVLAVDEQTDIVQKFASDFTHVVAADTTDTEALRQIGAEQFEAPSSASAPTSRPASSPC